MAAGARTALDLFTGTTRVAQELKRRGIEVTASDLATYSAVLSDCFVATDATDGRRGRELDAALERLDALPGRAAATSPRRSASGRASSSRERRPRRRDPRRHRARAPAGDPLRPILLTSLMLAADRVDSTTGVQMAYLKQWAPRAHRDLRLERPALLPGPGAHHPRRRLPTSSTSSAGRPGLRRPALQPAPLLHELPHLGDAGPLGRPRALRRRLQAGRQPRRPHTERLQQPPHHARGARRPARPGRAPRSSSCPTTTSRGSPPTR